MQGLTFYEMIFSMYMLSMTKWELDDELEHTQVITACESFQPWSPISLMKLYVVVMNCSIKNCSQLRTKGITVYF